MASPSVESNIYPSVEEVMNLARAVVNDSFQNGAGRVLTDSAPFSIQYLNSGIRWLQQILANSGVSNFVKDNFLLLDIPPVETPDPSVQVTISYTGYTIGTTETLDAPALPPDLIVPFVLRERATGSDNDFVKMHQPMESLPSRPQGAVFGEWEWRNDMICMVGATEARDLQMRYEARLPLIGTNANFAQTKIQIRDSADALAFYVAALFGGARGSAQAPAVMQMAEARAGQMVVRYARRDQRIQFRRRSFGRAQNGIPIGTYRS